MTTPPHDEKRAALLQRLEELQSLQPRESTLEVRERAITAILAYFNDPEITLAYKALG